jgi:hypothetical protein
VTVHIRYLNFTCGGPYIRDCGEAIGTSGNVTIDGGTFYGLGPIYNEYGFTYGGAIGNDGGTVQLQVDRIQSNKPSNCVNVPGCTG